jgi:hypothetical protein
VGRKSGRPAISVMLTIMRVTRFLTALLVIGGTWLCAQDAVDSAKLRADIDASYYHPDALAGLDCDVAIDFSEAAKQIGQSLPDETKKALRGLTIRAHAIQGEAPRIDFAWSSGSPATKEKLETSVRQALTGFYQMYWAIFGPQPMTRLNGANLKIETFAEGGHMLRVNEQSAVTTLEVDRDNVPSKISVDAPAMKAAFEFHFEPSPSPIPGDLRRLVLLDASQQIGTSNMNARVSMDYQTVERFQVPRHVSFGVGGAFFLRMEFLGCSVVK